MFLFVCGCHRFAAEIFHDLHEEVMATAARGHGLMVRVQQLEAEFPSIEKAFLSQTNHTSFFSNAGQAIFSALLIFYRRFVYVKHACYCLII